MLNNQIAWKGKLSAIILTMMVFLLLVSAADSLGTPSEPVLAGVSAIATETPPVRPHLEIAVSIMPAPVVGRTATVRIEVTSAVDEEQVTLFTQMSPEIDLTGGEATWVGPVRANEPLVHEFTITVREPGQWGIYMSAAALSGVWDDEKLHITSAADTAQVVSSVDYQFFQSKEEWPGDPAELIPHQFPQHPEPVVVSPEYAGGDP